MPITAKKNMHQLFPICALLLHDVPCNHNKQESFFEKLQEMEITVCNFRVVLKRRRYDENSNFTWKKTVHGDLKTIDQTDCYLEYFAYVFVNFKKTYRKRFGINGV